MSDPSAALARLGALLGPHGEPRRLDGGMTNHNYRISFGSTDYVVRVPGSHSELLGIDRKSEWAATCAAAKLGIGPAIGAMLDDPPCLVTRFIDGDPASPRELRDPAAIRSVARSLRLLHDSGTVLPVAFDPYRLVAEHGRVARAHGIEPPAAYRPALKCARQIERALTGPEHRPVPCHNDLLAANFVHDGDELRIVDWEYAGMNDRFFDLGNFAVNNELDAAGEEVLLDAYFGEPPTAARRAALFLMRYMSDFREAMWGVVQSAVSDVDFDFDGYARKHFERLGRAAADERRFKRRLKEARGARR